VPEAAVATRGGEAMGETQERTRFVPFGPVVLAGVVFALTCCPAAWGDGVMVGPRDYKGSIEERAQEAIIIFHGAKTTGGAVEDLIFKITVEGKARDFAWVIPFPNEPVAAKEDAALFRELFDYVEARKNAMHRKQKYGKGVMGISPAPEADEGVEVLSRRIVGKYDVAMVRETVPGALNHWLRAEGYQELPNAEDVIAFYRRKKYVFACVKVSESALETEETVDLHPLRFTFKTGGRDGIYFPMKMTGLQKKRFDVNLYVFYRFWLNDHVSKFGYEHRGFRLNYRDWDSPRCRANGGKAYSFPKLDPFLKGMSGRLGTVTRLFQKLHPGEKYYLTHIHAVKLVPGDVRNWADDLWLFPYYTNRSFVPFDARPGGCASTAWVH